MPDIQSYALIESYLKGELSGDVLNDFERQLETSPDLLKEVQVHRELYSHFNDEIPDYQLDNDKQKILEAYVESEEVKSFQAKLKAVNQNAGPELKISKPPAKVRSLRWVYAAAASVLLLIAGYFLLNQNNTIQPKDLYASVSTHESLSITEMGSTEVTLQDIEKHFKQKNYNEVLNVLPDFLVNLPETDKNYYNLLRTKGIAELETNQYEKALQTFDRLAKSDALIAEQGEWYMVLSYLKKGDIQKFKAALATYIKQNHSYKKEVAINLQKKARKLPSE